MTTYDGPGQPPGQAAAQVADTAKQEARNVADEAAAQARNLAGELRTQAQDQSRAQRDRLAQNLHSLSDELDAMARNGQQSGLAGQVVGQASGKARDLARYLEGREPGELLDDVRSLARRRPGAFLVGAAIAGAVVGRLTRGAAAAGKHERSGDASAPYAAVPTPVTPVPTPVTPLPAEPYATGPLDEFGRPVVP